MTERSERCGCVPLEYGSGPDNTTCDVHEQESERRGRYVAVFVEHPVYDARTLRLATDAVMTVADEEQQKLAAEVAALVATIFRAHKENNRLRATIERVRNALDGIALWVEVNGYPNTADVLEDIRTALEGESNV